MKLIVKGLLVASLLAAGLTAKESSKAVEPKAAPTAVATHDVQIFTSENADGKITPKSLEEAFKKAGFTISDNRDMNVPFVKQFKTTTFDVYNLFTLYHKETVMELAKEYPNFGLFAPMSMSIYTKKGSKKISIASLTPGAMAKIMGIPSDHKQLAGLGKLVREAMKSAMPNGSFETIPYPVSETKEALVVSFEMEVDAEEWEDEKDDLQMTLESELKPNGFVMAGFNDINYVFKEEKYEAYDFYDVYSICKLPVIYTIAQTRPEAGAFAPCSLFMYKKKGEDVMHMGFPAVANWISSLSVEDKKGLEVLKDAKGRMHNILTELTE